MPLWNIHYLKIKCNLQQYCNSILTNWSLCAFQFEEFGVFFFFISLHCSVAVSDKATRVRRWRLDFRRLYLPPMLIHKDVDAPAALWCPQPRFTLASIHNANEGFGADCLPTACRGVSREIISGAIYHAVLHPQQVRWDLERRQTFYIPVSLVTQMWSHSCRCDVAFVMGGMSSKELAVTCWSILLSVCPRLIKKIYKYFIALIFLFVFTFFLALKKKLS